MTVYGGNVIVDWSLSSVGSKRTLVQALFTLVKCFEPVFVSDALSLNETWFEIKKSDDLIKSQSKIEEHYTEWPSIILYGHPKISTVRGLEVIDYAKGRIPWVSPKMYTYGLSIWAQIWSSYPTQVKLRVAVESDDWFLPTTKLASLKLFNRCLAETKKKLQPLDFSCDGPSDGNTMKFSGLFNEKGFDIERIKKFQKGE